MAINTDSNDIVDTAVTEGGSYDIIRQRLIEHGDVLEQKTTALNTARATEFGSTEMAVLARTRVRTENNCIGRDIVQIGDLLVFGYNVFIGLKTSTKVEDVFSLYTLKVDGEQYSMQSVNLMESFLGDERFRSDFDELYRYYKETKLVQLVHRQGKLLAGFQIGDKLDDCRVFRWAVSEDGRDVNYIDNRGERDLDMPEPYDFEWTQTGREDIVNGRFPHINILDQVFVETLGGDFTVKIENNTENGQGVYSDPVVDKTQSLNDASVAYAKVGQLILVKVLPYREEDWRYIVYNSLTSEVLRIDSIGDSCVTLPEDHGIIFPDGYYLEAGEYKSFGVEAANLKFKRKIRSPNGEDVLYIFYDPIAGAFVLLSYNLITKTLQNPIVTHGYALALDGTAIVFTAEGEPTRIHPMQIWNTPFPVTQSFYSRIGNAGLVRGISDLFGISRQVQNEKVSARHYETLGKSTAKLFDAHFWIDETETQGIGDAVRQVGETVELIIDEYEKVESIRRHSAQAMSTAEAAQSAIVAELNSASMGSVDECVTALNRIRQQRGELATIREYRYIDLEKIAAMDAQLVELNANVSDGTAEFLAGEGALNSYVNSITELDERLSKHETVAALEPDLQELESISGGLDLLSELIATLKVDDATVQTRIIDSISDVYAQLNQTRAKGRQYRTNLGSAEAVGQFSAQFKLFSQSITNALSLANTPERCEEQLTRLLVQLEELESQFSEHERFLADILDKREEVHDTFSAHRQQLLDARQARAQTLADAVTRMLANIEKRAQRFDNVNELNTYLASDALVLKVQDIITQLRDLDSAVKADDADARLKMIKDMALRALRDKSDLYSDGGKIIKLGPQHKFSVNSEDLDLTIIPRQGGLSLHLVGTQFFEPIDHAELNALKPYWNLTLDSETDDVYRAEYLAYLIIQAARAAEEGMDWQALVDSVHENDALDEHVKKFAAPRYREGYQKGVHDADATTMLRALIPVLERADLLRFEPAHRALAQVFWAHTESVDEQNNNHTAVNTLVAQAKTAAKLHALFNSRTALDLVEQEVASLLGEFLQQHTIGLDNQAVRNATRYLVAELGREKIEFAGSTQADQLEQNFLTSLSKNDREELNAALAKLSHRPAEQWKLTTAWLHASISEDSQESLKHYIPEAAVQIILDKRLQRRSVDVNVEMRVKGLYGEHVSVVNGEKTLVLDRFIARLDYHCETVVPGYHKFLSLRHDIAEEARAQLRLHEFKPRPLSSFVRNRLINDAYLPIIGDNLAKQIGTVGDTKRSDLSGLLMMISPPGYGKTTLMEYVASRMGMTFMKINCPALGHDVDSLDPASASNATSSQELEKLNLALEMGDNVMLYLDDIQHTGAEFLQKFISLCDSTRRIEGVWKGKTRTYDMRGRKFCVVMAGNPYTESGEMFRVPDMLANRADIYNLGDVLSGKESQFELSYIENSLSSNPVLAPLATRDMADVYKLIDLARGKAIADTDLSHAYSSAEITEIKRVFQCLIKVQDTVLKVNQQYIASAAQEDKYRVTPRFLLQGSYRNMNKLAEKVSAVMNDEELEELINDHYRGESQLLTQGAEANQLMLGELRGSLDENDAARWAEIKRDFLREKAMGGDSTDSGQKIASQLADIVESMGTGQDIASQLGDLVESMSAGQKISNQLGDLVETMGAGQKISTQLGDLVETMHAGQKISTQLGELVERVGTVGNGLASKDDAAAQIKNRTATAMLIRDSLKKVSQSLEAQQTHVAITNTPSEEFSEVLRTLSETVEHTLFPLVRSMDSRIAQDVKAHRKLNKLAKEFNVLKQQVAGK